jgi:hypothetical protein
VFVNELSLRDKIAIELEQCRGFRNQKTGEVEYPCPAAKGRADAIMDIVNKEIGFNVDNARDWRDRYYDLADILEVPAGVSISETAKFRMNTITRMQRIMLSMADDPVYGIPPDVCIKLRAAAL